MKKTAIEILIYTASIFAACTLTVAIILPMMKSGDCPIPFQMLLVAIISGSYVFLFTPIVIIAEVLARKVRTHRLLPLFAIPSFGAGFGVLARTMPSPHCWPEEPTDMSWQQFALFLCLALLSIGVGTLLIKVIAKRRRSNLSRNSFNPLRKFKAPLNNSGPEIIKNTDKCYLCGSTKNLTRDHIPPKCLFHAPRPDNLITVPCCFDCNNGLSKQDELLRLFICGGINRNIKGNKLWEEKILPRTIQRGRLRNEVRSIIQSAQDCICQTPQGEKPAKLITVPQTEISDALIRIAKGLMYENARSVDRNSLLYEVIQINQFRLNEMIDPMVPQMKWNGERGGGTFRYWGGQDEENPNSGVWILMFFDSTAFAVFHKPKDKSSRSNKKRAT